MQYSGYFWTLLIATMALLIFLSIILRFVRRRPALRFIDAFYQMPRRVAASVETARPAHFSIGSSGIGDQSTLTTLASLALIYDLAQTQSFSENLPTMSLTDTVSLTIAQDTLRKTYGSHQNLAYYSPSMVAWFPNSDRSLAFGAGASALSADAKAYTNILVGQFGREIAFFGESSARHDQYLIGHSTSLEGQAITYAQSDAPLVGEELFVGNAYSDPNRAFDMASVITLDVLRWVAIAAIIIIAADNV